MIPNVATEPVALLLSVSSVIHDRPSPHDLVFGQYAVKKEILDYKRECVPTSIRLSHLTRLRLCARCQVSL